MPVNSNLEGNRERLIALTKADAVNTFTEILVKFLDEIESCR